MKKTFKHFGLAVLIAAIALNAMLITGCNDDSDPVSNGDGSEGNGKDGKYNSIDLRANRFGNDGSYPGEQWVSDDTIKLAHFTNVKPKQGDILQFKVSGVSNKELKYIAFSLAQITGGDWDTYKWLGGTEDHVPLPNTFNDYTYEITVWNAPDPNAVFIIQIVNLLWQKDPAGEYTFDSGETLGDIPDGTVMATISNFEISFVELVEDEPEEQTLITITNIPAAYNGMYAIVALFETMDTGIAYGDRFTRITNGKVENCAMQDERGEIFGKDGAYYVALLIKEQPSLNSDYDYIYTGVTPSKKNVVQGSNIFSANNFYPDITPAAPAAPAAPAEPDTAIPAGTYTAQYSSPTKEITETIELSVSGGRFLLYDDVVGTTPTTRDFIEFTITSWAVATPPTNTYTSGYKLTGKITGAKGYIPASAQSKTAPNFVAADVNAAGNGPECWMYIYFKTNTDGSITFIRTPFSKTGNVNTGIVTNSDGMPRVYTKY